VILRRPSWPKPRSILPGQDWRGRAREWLEAARSSSVEPLGLDIRIGLGGPGAGAESVARSYRDSLLAISYASTDKPVLVLSELGSLQSALAGADLATRQVIASHASRFATLPDATQALIAETVRAFAAASLNVSAAAGDLGLHPNTLRYRLARIADQTGHDPRTFAGLVELVCVLEGERSWGEAAST
jgi:sugar diacid utilization regulator